MECSDVVMRKDNEKSAPLGPRLNETLKQCMHTLKGPYPCVKNVRKAIRKKDCNVHVRLNGLATDYISKWNNKVYG